MIYFTADPHFNHSNILKLNNRPFDNIDQMNNKIIQNWNSCVDYEKRKNLDNLEMAGK